MFLAVSNVVKQLHHYIEVPSVGVRALNEQQRIALGLRHNPKYGCASGAMAILTAQWQRVGPQTLIGPTDDRNAFP